MKKKLLCVTSAIVLVGSVVSLASCGGKGDGGAVEAAIKEAQKMTYDELLVKAKEEIGDNTLKVMGNSSALDSALKAFTEKTGIKTGNEQLNDQPLYTKLDETISSGTYSADMVLIQDGNSLQTRMISTGYLKNYVPKDYKDILDKDDQNPTAAVYLNKIFMYNNTGTTKLENHITNVWQMAGTTADTGHVSGLSFKPASTENVNMNFLVMLTSDAWCKKLSDAYKAFYGKDYVKEEKYKNIGYKFIEEFVKNSQTHSSDGTALKNVASGTSGSSCLVNYNKLKGLKATTGAGSEDKANITVAAYEGTGVKGFDGFVYKMYTMLPKTAKYPYAACALVNYMLSAEGYNGAWGGLVGYYSTNPGTKIADGDHALSYWKERCVIEDPVYVAKAYSDVYEFVTSAESAKK